MSRFDSAAELTDELYQEHERYVEELEERLEQFSPVLRLMRRREELMADRDEYEAMIADPTRLLSRGGGAACVVDGEDA